MLKQRIQILKMGGVIGEDVAQFMNQVIDMMAADYPQIDMDHATMFTTHLAMALERIKKGEFVDKMDDMMWEDIQAAPEFQMAVQFRERMLGFCPVAFPESESQFIVLHICSMLEQ